MEVNTQTHKTVIKIFDPIDRRNRITIEAYTTAKSRMVVVKSRKYLVSLLAPIIESVLEHAPFRVVTPVPAPADESVVAVAPAAAQSSSYKPIGLGALLRKA